MARLSHCRHTEPHVRAPAEAEEAHDLPWSPFEIKHIVETYIAAKEGQ